MTAAHGRSADQTRAEIEKTRAELRETLQALAAKTNLKARGREKVARVRADLRHRAASTGGSARATVTGAPGMLGRKTTGGIRAVTDNARQRTASLRGSAAHGSRVGLRRAAPAGAAIRTALRGVERGLRSRPAPFVAVGLTVVAVAAEHYRRLHTTDSKRRNLRSAGRWW